MKRPAGVIVVAVLTFLGAAILALASFAFFVVAFMALTGGDAEEPVSAALAGMGIAGGFSLLVLAGVAVCLAIGVLKLREWARTVSIASVATGIACTVLSLFAFRRYVVLPVVPSFICHLIVLATAGCMVEYLSRPRVRESFGVLTRHVTMRYRSVTIPASLSIPAAFPSYTAPCHTDRAVTQSGSFPAFLRFGGAICRRIKDFFRRGPLHRV